MENKELLFNLIKKLESGEITLTYGKDNFEYGLFDTKDSNNAIKIGETTKSITSPTPYFKNYGKEDGNVAFKRNFYQEKGLDNCGYKDCSNKIYQKEGDYKAANIPCSDKHKRYICLNCYESKYGK